MRLNIDYLLYMHLPNYVVNFEGKYAGVHIVADENSCGQLTAGLSTFLLRML